MMGANLLKSGVRKVGWYRPPMAEINVTPFVDVMLVLLVIFMVTAPLMTQGVQVDLPEVESAPVQRKEEPIQISIKADGSIFLQTRQVSRDDVVDRLKAIQRSRPDAPIMLFGDAGVQYGKVMEIMGALQVAGLVDVNMVTEPPK